MGLLGRRWLGVVSLLGLALLYAAVLTLGDVRAHSGSDAGGKAATARAMASTDPINRTADLGYWAAPVDSLGTHHPIVNTTARSNGTWVQATSLPFSLASAWLWDWGGASGAILFPVVGGLLAAWSARRLARNLGATPLAAKAAFWLVGAVGPVAFYATDLWEHAPAAGLIVAFASVLVAPKGRLDAGLAGLAAGAAVVLRAETALVLLGLGVATLLVPAIRDQWLRKPIRVLFGGLGVAIPVGGNLLLEQSYLGGDLRGARAASLASGAASQLGSRLRDAALETGGPFADDRAIGAISGGLLVLCALVLAAVALGRWNPPGIVVRLAVVLGSALYLGRFLMGLGFVPGMVAVAPLAAAGLVAGLRRAGADPGRQVVSLGAAISIPLIWILQWQGNHAAQWGGRYLLSSGALLVVVGTVAVFEQPVPVLYRRAMIGLSVLVGVMGLAWHIQRTNQVGRAFDVFAALPAETTVVSTEPNLLREGGSWYDDGRWLTVSNPEKDLFGPTGLAETLQLRSIALVVDPRFTPELAGTGFTVTEKRSLDLPGETLQMLVLRRR